MESSEGVCNTEGSSGITIEQYGECDTPFYIIIKKYPPLEPGKEKEDNSSRTPCIVGTYWFQPFNTDK